jgi:hypothetical protein
MPKSIRNRNIRTAEPIADSGNREAFESARAAIIRVNRDIAAGNDVADKTLQFVREMAGIYRLHLVSDGVRTVTAPERDPELAEFLGKHAGNWSRRGTIFEAFTATFPERQWSDVKFWTTARSVAVIRDKSTTINGKSVKLVYIER